jgi:hypothetical protein
LLGHGRLIEDIEREVVRESERGMVKEASEEFNANKIEKD